MSPASAQADTPLVAHVIQHLIIGGLENGIVNLVNRTPPGTVRHAIVCLSHHSDFRDRIENPEVPVIALGKRPGKDPANYWRLWRTLRSLKPAIVHSRNYATVDCAPIARLAGVPVRIHGEHGWDMFDLDGRSRKHLKLRRAMRPFISRYVTVSKDMQRWLQEAVGVAGDRIEQIYNGVDTHRFAPRSGPREPLAAGNPPPDDTLVIGTVGRMQAVKDQKTLVEAFAGLVERRPECRTRLRLALVGDGPMRDDIVALLRARRVLDLCWLPGATRDVSSMLRSFDVFVLPSLNEGLSNTILEAMASGLPVIASCVGGNGELVANGETGQLFAARDVPGLIASLERYVDDAPLRLRHAAAARRRAEQHFSLDAMVASYLALYQCLAGLTEPRTAAAPQR